MAAIDIAMERYVKPIEHAWLATGISMQIMLDDVALILLNAWQSRGVYNKTDRLLVALVYRLKQDLLEWESSGGKEGLVRDFLRGGEEVDSRDAESDIEAGKEDTQS